MNSQINRVFDWYFTLCSGSTDDQVNELSLIKIANSNEMTTNYCVDNSENGFNWPFVNY